MCRRSSRSQGLAKGCEIKGPARIDGCTHAQVSTCRNPYTWSHCRPHARKRRHACAHARTRARPPAHPHARPHACTPTRPHTRPHTRTHAHRRFTVSFRALATRSAIALHTCHASRYVQTCIMCPYFSISCFPSGLLLADGGK